jgi:hypothetical protein
VTKPKNYVFIFATFGFFHNFEQVSRNLVHFCKILRILCKTCVFFRSKNWGVALWLIFYRVCAYGYRSSGVCCQYGYYGYGCVTGGCSPFFICLSRTSSSDLLCWDSLRPRLSFGHRGGVKLSSSSLALSPSTPLPLPQCPICTLFWGFCAKLEKCPKF